MIPGATVWYRVSDEDAEQIYKRRNDAEEFFQRLADIRENFPGAHWMDSPDLMAILIPVLDSGFQRHFGDVVGPDELLPAEVVRCYTLEEMDPQHNGLKEWGFDFDEHHYSQAHLMWSGIADIRVSLPGNDVLYVSQAAVDRNCTPSQGRGHGITSLPAQGRFTTMAPAELLQ